MATDFLMPKLAMAMNEGTVIEWVVEQGQYIEEGGPLLTVETEKVAYDIEAPNSGYFHILTPAGETVPVESTIGVFAESEEELASLAGGSPAPAANNGDAAANNGDVTASAQPEPATTATAAAPVSGGRIIASPLAKKMAADRGLDLAAIKGTGPNGRIVKRDILRAEQSGEGRAQVAAPVAAAVDGLQEKARIPMQGIRKTIADRMMQSLQQTAQLSGFWEADVTELMAVRDSFVAREKQLGTKVSMNSFLIKAMVAAIKQVPITNSALVGDEIVIYDTINVGIAVAMPGSGDYDSSLMVPVLKNVERMGVAEIDKAMKALIERVRNGEASAADMGEATITLSSTAGISPPGLQATPVLNMPNTTLVGPSTPMEKPVVHNGEIVPRTMMPISVTFDHRVVDGAPVSTFCRALHDALENPALMLA